MDDLQEKLAATNLFKGQQTNDILKILSHTHYQIKSYKKDQLIALSGETCDRLLIVLDGSVRGEMTDHSGKTIKIEDIKGPNTVASAFVFGHENKFPVNITANESTTMVSFSRDGLVKIFQENREVLINFLDSISTRSQFLTKKMKFLSFKTIQGKMAHYLLSLERDSNNNTVMLKSQTELAVFFGVARPSLARVMAEMEENDIIHIDKRKVIIKDIDKLKEMAV